MSPIDYSKWGHIDISDDEDLQHPNIDKASLWKWEKEARYARYEEQEKVFVNYTIFLQFSNDSTFLHIYLEKK
jgi:hypothetical protein